MKQETVTDGTNSAISNEEVILWCADRRVNYGIARTQFILKKNGVRPTGRMHLSKKECNRQFCMLVSKDVLFEYVRIYSSNWERGDVR